MSEHYETSTIRIWDFSVAGGPCTVLAYPGHVVQSLTIPGKKEREVSEVIRREDASEIVRLTQNLTEQVFPQLRGEDLEDALRASRCLFEALEYAFPCSVDLAGSLH